MVINAIVAVFELVRNEVKKRHQKKSPVGFPQVILLEFGVYQLIIYKKKNLINRRN